MGLALGRVSGPLPLLLSGLGVRVLSLAQKLVEELRADEKVRRGACIYS
jgi:hypothetical protein